MILTSRRQQRVLAAMYGSLRKSDPRLVARFTMFTELTGNAAMPAVERVRHKPLRRLVSGVRALARHRRHAAWRHRPAREPRRDWARWRLGGLVFIPALAAAMLAVVMLFSQGQAQGSCGYASAAASGSAAHSSTQHQPACPAGQIPVLARGR